MVAKGEALEGTYPVPSTYPNPMANNVNMHPIDAAYGDGIAIKQNDPILINGAEGSFADPVDGTA